METLSAGRAPRLQLGRQGDELPIPAKWGLVLDVQYFFPHYNHASGC